MRIWNSRISRRRYVRWSPRAFAARVRLPPAWVKLASMSRRLNSDTAPWKPTTGLGPAGTRGATDPAGVEKPPPGIGPCFAVSVLTGNPATQRECQ